MSDDRRTLLSASHRRPARVAAFAAAAALSVVACGDDPIPAGPDATFATSPAGPASTPPVATEPPTITTTAPDGTNPTTDASTQTTTAETSTTTSPASTAPIPTADPVVALDEIGSFWEPVDLAARPGDDALYVVERWGYVQRVVPGAEPTQVLDISDLTRGEGERGLLGLTFSLDGGFAYVNHTDGDGNTDIVEYAVADDGTFDEGSRRIVLEVDQPYSNHNGGNVTIGPDGMLYIGMGDGGSGGDPERYSLNLTSLLGKVLRIDPAPADGNAYLIPPDNPFVDVEGALPEIWAVGVRNPWRMSFDSLTGDLWIADVGQGALEEVSVGWAADSPDGASAGRGMNFGWSAFEGSARFNEDQPVDGATPPVWEYERDLGCSISGGAVYRGAGVPDLAGWYVVGDFCSGNLFAIFVADRTVVRSAEIGQLDSIAAVREGPDGELYVVSIAGTVARIVPG
jgi:glucose/arabinose dehydrogenase